jgi:hypothetical protein
MILIDLQIIFINFSILNTICGPITIIHIHIRCVPEYSPSKYCFNIAMLDCVSCIHKQNKKSGSNNKCSTSTLETKEWKIEYSTSIQKSSPVARVFNICEQQNKID